MDRHLSVKSALVCAALLMSVSCRTSDGSAKVKDTVDSSNAMFGTGRSAADRAAKRNCFKSETFSEEQDRARLSDESSDWGSASPDSGSSDSGSSASSSSIPVKSRLIKTRINQMNIQTYFISTSSTNSHDRTMGVKGGVTVPDGILKSLKISPEFTVKLNNVLQENERSNVDSYVLTVKYLSHALAIQPDESDFRSDAMGLLDGKENTFKRFLSACGDEFLSMKEYGGDITLVFGATQSDHSSTSDTNGAGHLGIDGPGGISGKISGNFGNRTGIAGVEQISNFLVNENALDRTSTISCTIPRSAAAGETTPVVHDHPFIPKNKVELDEFIYCLPRWIDAVPISFNYTDYANVFPLSLDQSVIDTYQKTYLASKKTWSDKFAAEEKAGQEQREKEQREQEVAKPGKQLPDKVALKVPKLKVVSPIPGTALTRSTPAGLQARFQATRKFIRENMVFATPSQCAIAGCDGYNEVDGACTRCQESVQAVSKSYGGINFCRNNIDCKEGVTCQAAGDAKTGICR